MRVLQKEHERMSDFVNYNKRDVNLPLGWKDLNQVLKAKGLSGAAEPLPEYSHCELVKPLWEIQRHISLVYSTKPLSVTLAPFAGERVELTVANEPVRGLHASVQVRMHTKMELAVLRFMETRGFGVPDNSVPPMFSPDLPVELFCDIKPLPQTEEQMARLATELFQEVCGLNQNSELTLNFHRWSDPEPERSHPANSSGE